MLILLLSIPNVSATGKVPIAKDPYGDKTEIRICLSPGHPSFEDDKLYEAVINRKVAVYLSKLFKNSGYKVLVASDDLSEEQLFRKGFDNEDVDVHRRYLSIKSPQQKAEICNRWNADYLISLHHNFAYNPKENYGVVFYSHQRESSEPNLPLWASMTAHQLKKHQKIRRVKYGSDFALLAHSLSVLDSADMAGILVEASFYSNPKERKRLNRNSYLKKEASAIYKGFISFRNRVIPPPS